jgi:hypothetical protein
MVYKRVLISRYKTSQKAASESPHFLREHNIFKNAALPYELSHVGHDTAHSADRRTVQLNHVLSRNVNKYARVTVR